MKHINQHLYESIALTMHSSATTVTRRAIERFFTEQTYESGIFRDLKKESKIYDTFSVAVANLRLKEVWGSRFKFKTRPLNDVLKEEAAIVKDLNKFKNPNLVEGLYYVKSNDQLYYLTKNEITAFKYDGLYLPSTFIPRDFYSYDEENKRINVKCHYAKGSIEVMVR